MNTFKKICGIGAICGCTFASSLSAQTPTPTPTATPTPTPHAINLTDVQVYKAGTNLNAVLRAVDDGHGAFVPAFILVDANGDPASLGGSSGGLTDTQLRASAVPVSVSGAQYTVAITVATTGATIAAGKHHIEFILSSDFAGTIAGAAINPAIIGVYDPGTLPVGSTFGALIYTISAGSATITTW